MTSRSTARHRADVRPTTFLSSLPCSTVARRGSLGVATAGLAVALVSPAASAYEAAPSPAPATTSSASTSSAGGSHTVQAGDTVAKIAQRHGTSVSAIIAANGLNSQALIIAGERLTIPSGSGSGAQASTSQASTSQASTSQASTSQASTSQASTSQASTSQASSGQASEVDRRVESASRSSERTEQASTKQVSAPANSSGSAIVDIARQHIGTPYVYGGKAPGEFDCSGFTSYVYGQVGISISSSSAAQRNAGTVISASEARPGDLVWRPGHVGIYSGNGNYIAAYNTSNPLSERPVVDSSSIYIRVG